MRRDKPKPSRAAVRRRQLTAPNRARTNAQHSRHTCQTPEHSSRNVQRCASLRPAHRASRRPKPIHHVKEPEAVSRQLTAVSQNPKDRAGHNPRTGPASRSGNAAKAGGADRNRTGDLLLAKQALSHLSYGPGSRGQPANPPARHAEARRPPSLRSGAAPLARRAKAGGPGKI